MDSHNIVCSWRVSSRLHSLMRFHERILPRTRNRSNHALLYHVPEEGVTSAAILASRVPIYGTMGARAEASNSGLQKKKLDKEEHKAKDNTERVQPITHDARHGLTRDATASKVHQSRFVTQSFAWMARQTSPNFSDHFSKIQSTVENARIAWYATSISTRGIHFCPHFLG